MGLGEQVAARAARRIGEVLFAIGVTAQTHVVAGARNWTVAGVTKTARRMLGLLMQTAQLGTFVARRARGRSRDTGRSVRAVTIAAIRTDFAVLGLGLGGVALGTRSRRT